jgi:nitrate reductase NapD
MAPELHISSLAVQLRPERSTDICAAIAALDGAQVHHATASGKVVVTLETANERQVMDRVEAIRALTGVLTVALVFHRIDSAA